MKSLKDAIAQVHKLTNQRRSPLIRVLRNINLQKQKLVKQINKPLSSSTKNIKPIANQVKELQVSIIRSVPYKNVPKELLAGIKGFDRSVEENEENNKDLKKMTIIPVRLEKPISTLTQSAVEIQNATFIKKTELPVETVSEHKFTLKDSTTDVKERKKQIEYYPITDLEKHDISETEETQSKTKPAKNHDKPGKDMVGSSIPMKIKNMKFLQEPDLGARTIHKEQDESPSDDLVEVQKEIKRDVVDTDNLAVEYASSKKDESKLSDLGYSTSISADSLAKKEVADQEFTTKPKKTKTVVEKSITPIVSALGLLAGRIKGRELLEFTPEQIKKQVIGPVPEADQTKIADSGKIFSQRDLSSIEPIGTEKLKKTETTAEQIQTTPQIKAQQDKTSEVESDDTTKHKLTRVAEVTEQQSTPDIELSPVAKRPKPKLTSWVPISAAIGSIANLAAINMVQELQISRRLGTPKMQPSASELLSGKRTAVSVESIDTDKVMVTARRAESSVRHRTPSRKLLKTTDLESSEVTPAFMVKGPGRSEGHKIKDKLIDDQVLISPAKVLDPSSQALSILGLMAKHTKFEDQLIQPPKKDIKEKKSIQDETDRAGIITKKRFTMADASLPLILTPAVSGLGLAAERIKRTMLIDKIEKADISIKDRNGKDSILSKIKQPITDQKGTTIDSGDIEKGGKKRSMLLDLGSIGALDMLNDMAITTSVARAEAIADFYSKPLSTQYGSPDFPIRSMKKIPVTRSVSIESIKPSIEPSYSPTEYKGRSLTASEISAKPDYEPTFEEPIKPKIDGRAEIQPLYTTGGGIKALDMLWLIAASTSSFRKRPVRRVLQKPILQPSKHKLKPESEKAGLTDLRSKPSGLSRPSSFKRFFGYPKQPGLQSIAEAMGIIQARYEQKYIKGFGLGYLEKPSYLGKEPSDIDIIPGQPGSPVRTSDKPITIPSRTRSLKRDRKTLTKEMIQERLDKVRAQAQSIKDQKMKLKEPKPPVSADFDWLPKGAPKKRDENLEQIITLEEQVRLLKERLSELEPGRDPSNKKLQEFVHDPNLQTQLKKLFYESWLENMEKELKRYGG